MNWVSVDMRTSGAPAPGTLLILNLAPELLALATVDALNPAPSAMHCLVIASKLLLGLFRCQLAVYLVRSSACGPAPSPDDGSMVPLPVQDGLGISQPPTPRQFGRGRPLRVVRDCPGVGGQYWIDVATQPFTFELEEDTKYQETATGVCLPATQVGRLFRHAARLAAGEDAVPSSSSSASAPVSTDLFSESDPDSGNDWDLRSEGVLESLQLDAILWPEKGGRERTIAKIEQWRAVTSFDPEATVDVPTLSNTGADTSVDTAELIT
ncbi:hypothetical protein C8R46DRAFT_279404 [Mycena filopes]|nr:hypothetical protein C8R46DRAFT_279404 [Mycena filopes]